MPTSSLNYTYIYFNTLDYTGNSVLSSYTLSNTPLKFVPDFTTSSILSGAQNISSKTLRWEFGDGSFSTDLRPSHVYQWPGEYEVSLTVYDGSGNAYDSTFTTTVQIFNYIANQISFADYKSLVYDIPTGKLIDPLTVYTYFSWQSYQALSATGYTINLYASGARGAYDYVAKEQNDKWSHLRSLSRFYILSTINGFNDYVTVESVQPTVTPIYVNIQNNQLLPCQATDPGSIVAGVTGSCQFWYTDDKPGDLLTESSPVIIFASVDNSKFKDAFTQRTNAYNYISYPPYGYQNIDPAVFPNIKIRYNPADHLSITTTGIDGEGTPVDHAFDIPYISWQNTEVPYVIKFKDNQDFTTKNYPPLSSSITQNTTITPQPQYDIQTGIVYSTDDGSYTALDGVTFYEDFASQAPQSIGAFYKGYFISKNSTENCHLTASVNVIDPPYYVKDALVNWLTIPQYNSAIRILRQEKIDGFDGKTIINFPNTAIYSINANNVYAITVAPSGATADSDYQTWFADPVGDQLSKYDVYGNLLQTYQLSAMVTLINNQTSIIDYRYPTSTNSLSSAAPNDIALDNKNNLWVSLIDSGVVIKINNSNGFVTTVASLGSASKTYTLSSDYTSLSGYAGENLALPASIDTDRDNNLWVAYTHPDYSALIKYQGENNFTTAATVLTSIIFPDNVSPEQIQIDRNGYIWVTAINHNSQSINFSSRNDYLFKYDNNGNSVPGYPLSGFQQIGNLAIDGNQNAWVVQGAETLTKVDGVLGTTTNYVAGQGNNITEYICSIGGITCDTSNSIWVINNFDKNIYIFDANTPSTGVFNPKYTIPLSFPTPSLPPVTAYPFDADTAAYISRASITDRTAQNQLDQFVKGIKSLGLWDAMVAWPMQQLLNAGSGSTVYSLGGYGTYNGTMNGSAAWSPGGITFISDSDYIDYGTFNVNISGGGFSVLSLFSGMGVPVTTVGDNFNFFRSSDGNASLTYQITNGVSGGTSWEFQASHFNPNYRIYDLDHSYSSLVGTDIGFGWNADYITSPALSTSIFLYNGKTTKVNPVDHQQPSSSGINGNYTMRSYGRGNTSYAPRPSSRISYLIAFKPGINMTNQTMSAVYTLCQSTLCQGDPDVTAFIKQAGITDLNAKTQIYQFVTGAKQLGIWNNLVCWPMAQRLNVGSGTTLYSLGGLSSYPATFPSTPPVWTADGLYSNQYSQYGISDATILDFSHFTMGAFWKIVDTNYQNSIGTPNAGVGSVCGWGGGGQTTYISADGLAGNAIDVDFPEASSGRLALNGGTQADGTSIGIIATKDSYLSTGYLYTTSSTPTTGTKITSLSANGTGSPFYLLGRAPNYAPRFTTQNFVFLLNKTLSANDVAKFYSLYASTLGTGLGLASGQSLGFTLSGYPSITPVGYPQITPTPDTYSDGFQEFQAYGDWNGYNWLNKYAAPISTIRTITGSSALFNIYPDSGQFNIAKINENWNASGYYDSLRFQETLLDKQVFFDEFLGVILGGLNAQPYELGKTVYEKIANFVDNNSDIDKVNVNELLSFCRELSIEFTQYNVMFPPQLRRLVDMLSIKQSKLWGIQNKYNTNFDPRGTQFTNTTYGTNLGSIIDPLTGIFTNGVPIVAQETFSGNYKLVNTNIIDDVTYVQLVTSYDNWVNQVIITGAGEVECNGTYIRTNQDDSFIGPNGYTIGFSPDPDYWEIRTPGSYPYALYRSPGYNSDFITWEINDGIAPAPTGTPSYPPRYGNFISLSSYTSNWGWGLVAPDVTGTQINNYYTFYTYNPTYSNTYYDNIINWNDPHTTLLPTNSAYTDWSQNNGIMQSLLSYELTKGFKLFTSAAHITYNS